MKALSIALNIAALVGIVIGLVAAAGFIATAHWAYATLVVCGFGWAVVARIYAGEARALS